MNRRLLRAGSRGATGPQGRTFEKRTGVLPLISLAFGCSLITNLDFVGGRPDPASPGGGAGESPQPTGGTQAAGGGSGGNGASEGGSALVVSGRGGDTGGSESGTGGMDGGAPNMGGTGTGGDGSGGAGEGGMPDDGGSGGDSSGGNAGSGGAGKGGSSGAGGSAGKGGTAGAGGVSGTSGTAGNEGCAGASLTNDPDHCGMCMNMCPMDEPCIDGICVSSACEGLCESWEVLNQGGDGFRKEGLNRAQAYCFQVTGYVPQSGPKRLVCWNFDGRGLKVNDLDAPCVAGTGHTLGMERAGGYCVQVGAGGNRDDGGFLFPLN